jgi:hypothetical protein
MSQGICQKLDEMSKRIFQSQNVDDAIFESVYSKACRDLHTFSLGTHFCHNNLQTHYYLLYSPEKAPEEDCARTHTEISHGFSMVAPPWPEFSKTRPKTALEQSYHTQPRNG